MTSVLFWLLVAVAAGLAAWRVTTARRRAAAQAAQREQASVAALAAARAAAPRKSEPAAAPPATDERASARAKAERVIAAEVARRKAALKKAENAARAEAERRAPRPIDPASTIRLDTPVVARPAAAAPAPRPVREASAPRGVEATTPILPPVPVPAPAPVVAAAPAPAPRPPAPRRVLKTAAQVLVMLVDDSKMVRVKSSRLLASHEFQVVTAVDGLDALSQLEHCCPDIVITDVDMPGLDGFGLAAALRDDPRTRHLPIVMITSAEDRHREAAHSAGVGLVMGKPYDEAALIAHIRSFSFFAEDVESLACA
jgi:CheY-like chemotaxis protein